MKTLDFTENDLLRKIVENYQNDVTVRLYDLMDQEFQNIEMLLDYENDVVKLRFDRNVFTDDFGLIYTAQQITWKLMKFVTLLNDLQEMKFIFLFQDFPNPKPLRLGAVLTIQNSIIYEIPDQKVCHLIIENILKTIVVGQYLVDYVNNNFKTREQIRHDQAIELSDNNLKVAKESLRKSSQAILIAVAVGCLSILLGLISLFKPEKEEIKLDSKQFNKLNTSIIENKNIQDTIKTQVSIKQTKTTKITK
jgi:hypothetical protein